MNSNKRQEINNFAEQIRNILEVETPVNTHDVVSRLKGDIKYADNVDGKEAKIEKINENNFEFRITLPHYTNVLRDRFTIAHELGHLFLHMGYLVDNEKWIETPEYQDSAYYRFGHSQEEYEANEFAASFLMPQKEFIMISKKYLEHDKYNLTEIANHFGVSEEAARTRGRFLGLFDWGG
ncbi:ImmA/IrrE family metallo-endopeptidase [Lysinibacillus fusiformis]|uniref:ImmA/IrrE family metallo-endopeptidase n=1 Tax=Lysinibacillus fusiformis TaxID=28031 RepID=UPI002D7711A2|nr:ImmA/IrrE family metallo-endopeptidase [Lysinibacillus fusiformis]WRS97507.1 ImmA/IrrE family metallo-endopeptidase [Lysinibacillus fusiformis]